MINIFVHDFKPRQETKGKIKGYRKRRKSKPVIRVGGRKVSAAPTKQTKYKFPVEVRYKNSAVDNYDAIIDKYEPT
jgi:hypothetical protein